jgi:LemA protein
MQAIIIVIIAIVVVALAALGWAIGAHNHLVRRRNLVEESWNQIDVELNRRYDLVPNLVNTIKGATSFEKSTLESVVGLRNQAAALAGAKADPAQRAQIEQQLTSQLHNLVSVTVEAYPGLQSNANFGQLQAELSQIESRIANARKYYNANVGHYNTAIQTFPNSVMAGMGHFAKADYFQIQDPLVRATPVVDFAGQPDTPALPQQMGAPFAQAPAAPGDWAQPDFTRQSGLSDGR